MRIVVDMQGAQTESRFRGIGRYTIEFVQAVIRNKGEHEIILVLSGLFPETIEPIKNIFSDSLPAKNIRVWNVPGPINHETPENFSRQKFAELVREHFLASLGPDIIHITSLFEGYIDNAISSVEVFDLDTPVSIVLYDLIPFLNPEQYLTHNHNYAKFYYKKIEQLKKSKRLLSISNYARQEGIENLQIPPERIVNISTAIGENFKKIEINSFEENSLKYKFGIKGPFVLYTGGSDDRKNLPRLIISWAKMPKSLRKTHQLVFAGKMPDGNFHEFRKIACEHGLAEDELLFTGYVSDTELVQLYNLCRLYVFPSWHEGFGLPALEAMACGAPVIGANTTSLPEVIGLDSALFDPLDTDSISNKIVQVLSDDLFSSALIKHGLEQAKKFSWDKSALIALETWEDMASGDQCKSCSKTWKTQHEHYQKLYEALLIRLGEDLKVTCAADDYIRELAICLEQNECQILEFYRKGDLPNSINWRLEGPFDSSYSLALVNRELAKALVELDQNVLLHSTEGPGDFAPNSEFLAANPDLARMYADSKRFAAEQAEVCSRNIYPPRVAEMHSKINILHSYAWEESGFPSEWINDFNGFLQGICVTSKHVEKILIDHGVTAPISVTSNGVDHWENIASDSSYRVTAKSFRFLHVSSCFPRKGADSMLRAYGQAFSAKDDVTLIIKTFPNPHNEIHAWLAEARKENSKFPDVVILEEDLSDSQLKSLYTQCNVLVAPSRAEGFGLPMAEAMLSGLAVITTNWGGQTDFCTPETAWLVDYTFQNAKSHFGIFSSVWAEPNIQHLSKLMRETYDASPNFLKEKSAWGRELLLRHYRWTHAAQRSIQAVRRFAVQTELSPAKIGWVSSWNSKCGIAMYSKHLIDRMPSKIKIFASHTKTQTYADDDRVIRCWEQGNADKLENLHHCVQAENIDILVIQFNYGLFDFEPLANFLKKQLDSKIKVALVLHATQDSPQTPQKRLRLLLGEFSRCERILVHSTADLNRLKEIGLTKNVSLFPHGVADFGNSFYKTKSTLNQKTFTIGSYGFFLPHKGLIELIKSVDILRKQKITVHLKMMNAEYSPTESQSIIAKAKEEIESRNLNNHISLCTEFLSIEDSLQRMSECDLLVFPYQLTGESSSAAVRDGIASGCPVAVSPLGIFDDVSGATYTLPGTSPRDIAAGIKNIMESILLNSEIAQEVNRSATRWREQHDYEKISMRLDNMLQALHRKPLTV